VANGADAEWFTPDRPRRNLRRELGLENEPLLLTVGRMCERKGQETVIRSLPIIHRQLPLVTYLVVGHPEKQAQLEQLALLELV